MALSDDEIRQAETAMQAEMEAGPRAVAARYDRRRARIVLSLDSGIELAFRPDLAEGLDKASAGDLAIIEISSTGLGLHWPKLDADLWLPALLHGVFGSPRWMGGKRIDYEPAATSSHRLSNLAEKVDESDYRNEYVASQTPQNLSIDMSHSNQAGANATSATLEAFSLYFAQPQQPLIGLSAAANSNAVSSAMEALDMRRSGRINGAKVRDSQGVIPIQMGLG